MPHQCTQCGHTFPDGSKEMLSGCPDCGGNKFRFKPTAEARETNRSTSPETPSASESQTPTELASDDEPTPRTDSTTSEDRAQADARRDVASREELAESEALDTESDEDSDMAALRRELDDQFESIKILEPGQYELNLMELYNREEYIIALQEDGQYVIEVPESWLGGGE